MVFVKSLVTSKEQQWFFSRSNSASSTSIKKNMPPKDDIICNQLPMLKQKLPATVPGVVHLDLLQNKVIKDPYVGFNETKQHWIALSDWQYETVIKSKIFVPSLSSNQNDKFIDQDGLELGSLCHENEQIFLNFQGLDTICDVYCEFQDSESKEMIISEKIGFADNMFCTHRFDVKQSLQRLIHLCTTHDSRNKEYKLLTMNEDKNFEILKIDWIIRLEFHSAIKYSKKLAIEMEKIQKYSIPCPQYIFSMNTQYRNYIRKCGCDFAWDWGPGFASCGIYKPLQLMAIKESEAIISNIKLYQKLSFSISQENKPLNFGNVICDEAELTFHTYFQGFQSKKALKGKYEIFIYEPNEKEQNFIAKQEIDIEISNFDHSNDYVIGKIHLIKPKLWWPNGYGRQYLYDVVVRFTSHKTCEKSEKKIQIGIRNFELDTSSDKYGKKFQFVINKVPIYSKGANWIPCDCFHPRVTVDHLFKLLQSVKECSMNTIRVWGGGIYPGDEFFTICDNLGIMVFHDLMFACSLYPSNETFLKNVERECTDQIKRLQYHPSIVVWAGNNEIEEMIKTWEECEKIPYERLKQDYTSLFLKTIYEVVKKEDPSRPYWPSSPSNGIEAYLSENNNPQDATQGDIHYWKVWHQGGEFTDYQETIPRFCSEFGFQSLPSIESLAPYLNDNYDSRVCHSVDDLDALPLNIYSPEMEFRQRSPAVGSKCIMNHMAREFLMPTSLRQTIYQSQVLQSKAISMAVQHWRRQMKDFRCAGALYWQLNDIWPGFSWSSIEWNGKWKLLHYESRRFFAPVMLSMVENKEMKCIDIWLTNDLRSAIQKAKLKTNLICTRTGKILKYWNETVEHFEAIHSDKICSVPLSDIFGDGHDGEKLDDANYSFSLYNEDIVERIKRERVFLQCSLHDIKMVCKKSNDEDAIYCVEQQRKYHSEISDIYWFCPFKKIELERPSIHILNIQIQFKDEAIPSIPKYQHISEMCTFYVQFSLNSSVVAPAIYLSWKSTRTLTSGDQGHNKEEDEMIANLFLGRFSDNNFVLMPSETKTVAYYSMDIKASSPSSSITPELKQKLLALVNEAYILQHLNISSIRL